MMAQQGGPMADTRNTLAVPRAVNPSAFGTLEAASACAFVAARRVEDVVRRLCGAVPESGEQLKQSEPNGLLDAATRQAVDVQANMNRIAAALDRLETQLP